MPTAPPLSVTPESSDCTLERTGRPRGGEPSALRLRVPACQGYKVIVRICKVCYPLIAAFHSCVQAALATYRCQRHYSSETCITPTTLKLLPLAYARSQTPRSGSLPADDDDTDAAKVSGK